MGLMVVNMKRLKAFMQQVLRIPYLEAYVAIFTLFYLPEALAVDINVATMLKNLSDSMPELMRLVTAFSYVLGMFMATRGVVILKDYGESRSMHGGERHHLKNAIIHLCVGAALLYIPSSVQTGMATFWSDPNPYAYVVTEDDPWSELLHDCFLIMQLVGTIAFIRGLLMLTQLGSQSHQPGIFGKAMAFIISGVLCIDMYDLVNAMLSTLGLGQIL